tara:strand:- start:263 stop:745 length:483 start_codon:yes stop_codon:yes gene_type:complete
MSKKLLITIVFILFTSLVSAQLHHQMLSSQGSTVRTDNGIIATQTIGQQSVIGNYSNGEMNIGQGFQQANWARIMIEETTPEFEVSIFPNPFDGIINIQHNSEEDIAINVFDPAGKLVFENLLNVTKPNIEINLDQLPSGMYLIHLQSNQLAYFTKLVKK